jgi:nucleoside-diphosphate-sugar epimerase
MNFLITGAFGFIGTNLSIAFKTSLKHRLIGIDIAEADHHIFDEFYSWNEVEKVDWSKLDTIIHLAGKAHDTKNTSLEKEYFDINVGLTQRIFQHFLKSSARKFFTLC